VYALPKLRLVIAASMEVQQKKMAQNEQKARKGQNDHLRQKTKNHKIGFLRQKNKKSKD